MLVARGDVASGDVAKAAFISRFMLICCCCCVDAMTSRVSGLTPVDIVLRLIIDCLNALLVG